MCKRAFAMFLSVVFFTSNLVFAQAPAVQEADPKPAVVTEVEKLPKTDAGCISVNFKDADVKAVLSYLSEVGGMDIVPMPDVTGPVSLKLTNKPWMTALELVVKNYGYTYVIEDNLIRVGKPESLDRGDVVTEVIQLNYVAGQDVVDHVNKMLTAQGKISMWPPKPGVLQPAGAAGAAGTRSQAQQAAQSGASGARYAAQATGGVSSDEVKDISDTRGTFLIITDVASNIYKIKQFLLKIDKKLPQIMIEAKIIETELGENENMGIDWNILIRASGASRPFTFPFNSSNSDWGLESRLIRQLFPVGTTGTATISNAAGGQTTEITPAAFPINDNIENLSTYAFPYAEAAAFTYGTLDFTQFSAIVDYLKNRKNTEIVSNPRITTVNNKTAKIFVGNVYNYVSDFQRDNQTKEVTYKFSQEEIGISLLVTPYLNENGEINIRLLPAIKDVIDYQQITPDFQLPIFSTREAKTEVVIKDNDTIFIGGLIKDSILKYENKFPILGDLFGDVPGFGQLVKFSSDRKKKTELIFFITVKVLKDKDRLVPINMDPGYLKPYYLYDGTPQAAVLGKDITVNNAKVEKKAVSPLFDFRKKTTAPEKK